jgi:signal-transduction protein with cAMP-binding, CBS, and nucleotidyltransferase domain
MPEPQGAVTEYHDEYSETLGAEVRKLEDALLSDTVSGLISVEPLRLQDTTSVEEAVQVLLARDQSAVVVVDQDGHLNGIATDRDLLRRACEPGRNTDRTRLADVMTHDPETLRPDDRICFAVNRMMALGCRTMPLVDEERRPIGRALSRGDPEPAPRRSPEAASPARWGIARCPTDAARGSCWPDTRGGSR